jgi:hypothetical protein
VAQARNSHRRLAAKSRVNPCRICGGHRGTGTGFSPSSSGFSLSVSFHRGSPSSYITWGLSVLFSEFCCSILDYLTNGFQTACVMQSQMVRSVNYGSKIIWMKAIVAYFKIHSLNFSGETEENESL